MRARAGRRYSQRRADRDYSIHPHGIVLAAWAALHAFDQFRSTDRISSPRSPAADPVAAVAQARGVPSIASDRLRWRPSTSHGDSESRAVTAISFQPGATVRSDVLASSTTAGAGRPAQLPGPGALRPAHPGRSQGRWSPGRTPAGDASTSTRTSSTRRPPAIAKTPGR